MIATKIPSPPEGWDALHLGPLQIHAYAIAILTGIFFAIWLARRRWVARGGDPLAVEEIALWAVPFGIVGGRIYHVISTPGPYFGAEGRPLDAFKVWQGGLGIWGAVAIGALGAWIACRRLNVSFSAFMDAAAPGVLIAQAIGRVGNYFNQELFGGPTTLPWGLEVQPYQPSFPSQYPVDTLFHPTFLYELLWNLAGAALILILDRRLRLRFGEVFWLYVVVYTAGRLWIEMLRIDEAVHVFGVRINVWVSILVLVLGIAMFALIRRKHSGEMIDDAPTRGRSGEPSDQAAKT
ncbi:MAG: prolipoprotein diacylglyceryl transferase [Demequinaceae bacterium]|nr:prolipoprotein diacylglyceryl transferase [Demequinaceae bacterium]